MSIPAKILLGTVVAVGAGALVIARLNKSSEVTCRNIPVTREW